MLTVMVTSHYFGSKVLKTYFEMRFKNFMTENSIGLQKLWCCQQSVVSIMFDTTASNAGHVTGANYLTSVMNVHNSGQHAGIIYER